MRTALMLLLAGCGRACEAPETGDAFSGERNVIVLVLDGLRVDESFGGGHSTAADRPTADIFPALRRELLSSGALVQPGYAAGITITAPGHAALATGVRGAFGNYPNDGAEADAYRPDLPTLFEELRRQHDLPPEAVLLGGNTRLILPVRQSSHPGYAGLGAELVDYSVGASDPEVLVQLRGLIEAQRPRLAVINLHSIDRAGHSGADGAYVEQAQALDGALLGFWEWLQAVDGYGSDTVLILVADHGRHRTGEDEDWRNHGDHCGGCREIPMFLVGPGIAEGAVVEEQHTLVDLTQTIAHLLDIEMPYSEGALISGALSEPPADAGVRSGAVRPAVAGARVAVQRWADGVPRSVVEIDGEVVSGEGVFAAEAPVMLETAAGTVVCWRELEMAPGAALMPWYGACARDYGSGWEDMGFPEELVWPLWEPSLHEGDDGTLWMAMVSNSSGTVGTEASSAADIRVMRYDADAGEWVEHSVYDNRGRGLVFPTHARFATTGGRQLTVAFGTSNDGEGGRRSRRIDVVAREPGTGWQTMLSVGPTSATEADLDLTVEADRLERPALRFQGGAFLLGMVAYTVSGETHVVATRSPDAGASWEPPARLDDSGRVFPHISPQWDDSGALLWAQKSTDGLAEVCRGDGSVGVVCVSTGAEAIQGLAVDGETIAVSVRSVPGGVWEIVEIDGL